MIGIYKITNKINNKSYIGQSINIERRWKEHQEPGQTSVIHNAIIKYGVENFSFEILELCSYEELNEKEIYWISYFDTFNNGYNCTLGGDSGYIYNPQEILEKYNELQNINQTAKYFQCHPQTIRNIIHSYGIYKTDQQLPKIVEQINMNTLEVINTYDSIQDAAKAMNVSRAAIIHAINGTHNSAAGYFWKLQGEDKSFNNNTKSFKRQVQQINKDTKEIIATYNSLADAAEAVGKTRTSGPGSICSVCKGKKKTAYGFIWKYV